MIFTTSPNPRVLLVSGIHGDEWEVIDFVKEALEKHRAVLPPLLYIPELSPSAVFQKTRLNKDGIDINRSFFIDTDVSEVKQIQELLKPHHFDLAVSFHEDPSQDQFYLYDTGAMHEGPEIADFLGDLDRQGIPLWSGIDDDNDPMLGYEVIEGYAAVPPGVVSKERDKGFLEFWLIDNVIAQHALTLEVPGKSSPETKRAIIDAFFRFVIVRAPPRVY